MATNSKNLEEGGTTKQRKNLWEKIPKVNSTPPNLKSTFAC